MRSLITIVTALAVASFLAPAFAGPAAANGGPSASLVRDIHPTGGSDPRALTRAGDRVFFTANDGTHGRELWVTDGSTEGTRLVRDIRAGSSGSAPRDLTAVRGRLFFTANDGIHGRELWRSDGTKAGTRLVRDLRTGSLGARIRDIAALGDAVLLTVQDRELWRSDGTIGGTRPIRSFRRFVSLWESAVSKGNLYLVADDRVWRTDGTMAGTRWLTRPQWSVSDLTSFAGRVWFGGAEPTDGCCGETPRLWRSDGTQAGTRRVPGVLAPADLTVLGGRLYFVALGSAGPRLFVSDGSMPGTDPVKPRVRPLRGMLAAAGHLWASRMSVDLPWADELWVSNGTAAGTGRVKGGSRDWFVSQHPLAAVGLAGRLWFAAGPGEVVNDEWTLTDEEPWVSDGTPNGTTEAVDIHPTSSSSPRELVRLGRSVLFSAGDGEHGRELWVVSP